MLTCVKCHEKPVRSHDLKFRYCESCKPIFDVRRNTACEQCGGDISKRHRAARFCFPCIAVRARNAARNYIPNNDNQKARAITNCAVRVGFLPDPRDFLCVDCNRPAECYDHRDYNKPLEVEPVCRPCNSSRGAGIPLHINHESTQLTTTAA